MDKNGIVKSWCDFAKDDLITAKYLLGLHPLKLEIICYHCQQSAEKILKGFLIDKKYTLREYEALLSRESF